MDIAKIVSIYFLSSLKFFSGPLGGFLAGFNIYLTIGITVAGMMTAVVAFTFFGQWFKQRIWNRVRKKKKKNI